MSFFIISQNFREFRETLSIIIIIIMVIINHVYCSVIYCHIFDFCSCYGKRYMHGTKIPHDGGWTLSGAEVGIKDTIAPQGHGAETQSRFL